MKSGSAQIVRRAGLVVEALCMIGLVASGRRNVEGVTLFGLVVGRQALMIGLAVGLALWLTGTALIYWPKRRPDG